MGSGEVSPFTMPMATGKKQRYIEMMDLGTRPVSPTEPSTTMTIGMVKGLTSPDPMQLDLMRTYYASTEQVLWKLRFPASLPFLFASLKVAIAIALTGAIVGELPTGAQAGIGARMLTGSYYGQTVQIWAALVAASLVASGLVYGVGGIERFVGRRLGAQA